MEGEINFDGFELRGAKSIADYTGGQLSGLSAIAEMPMGLGKIIVLGTVPKENFFMEFLDKVGIPKGFDATDNVVAIKRTGKDINGLFVLELKQKSGYIVLDRKYEDIITGEELQGKIEVNPYQVRALRLM